MKRIDILNTTEKKKATRIPCVVTFHPDIVKLSNILRENYFKIATHSDFRHTFKDPPMVAYKKVSSLKNHLVKTDINFTRSNSEQKNTKCNRPRCMTCSIISTANHFTNKKTNKSIEIKN